MTKRSIITLQLGNYSNYVGAHFWNIQHASSSLTDVDHEVLFRAGEETGSTPRLVSADLKGALRLPCDDQTDPKDVGALWDGPTKAVVDEEEPRPSETLWSDLLAARLHPRSSVVLEHPRRGDDEAQPFVGFGDSLDCVEDGVRFFAEESDYLGAFHLLADADTGFGGVGAKVAGMLEDEYPGKPLLSFSCAPFRGGGGGDGLSTVRSASFFLNSSLSLVGLSRHSALVSPLSVAKDPFPLPGASSRSWDGVSYDASSTRHSSAILAAAVDTVTLPWRSSAAADVCQTVSCLNSRGRRWAGVAFGFPERRFEPTPLAPRCGSALEGVDVQVVSVRGMSTAARFENAAYSFAVASPLPTVRPFLPVFAVGGSVQTLALWQSGRGIGECVETYAQRTAKINLRRLPRFTESGLEADDVVQAVEDLRTLSDCYKKVT